MRKGLKIPLECNGEFPVEEQQHLFFDSFKFPICIIGVHGELVHSNHEFKKIFETGDDALSLDWSHPFFPEYRKRIASAYLHALDGHERSCFGVMRSREGRELPVEIYLFPMTKGAIVSSILVFMKFVDRRMFSFDSSASHSFDDNGFGESDFYNLSPVPIMQINRRGDIVKWSAALESFSGFTRTEIITRPELFYKSISLYDFERLRSGIARIFSADFNFKRISEVRMMIRGDEERWANLTLYPCMEKNSVIAVEIVIEDITRIRELENKINKMNRLHILSDFTRGFLYSFNGIMDSINAKAHMLLANTGEEGARRGLHLIIQNANEGSKQIRRIQDFIGTAGRIEEKIDFSHIVTEAIQFCTMQFRADRGEQRKSVHIKLPSLPEIFLKEESRAIRDMVISMIFKASFFIHREGEIDIKAHRSDGLSLSVSLAKDPEPAGEGISDAPFDSTSLSDIDIRRLAEKINIKIIEEESLLRYSITAVLPPRIIVGENKGPVSADPDILAGHCIALVCDDSRERAQLSELFVGRGNRVDCYKSGEEAHGDFRKGRFDFLISGYIFPGMTGLELAARVREIDERVLTILLTDWPPGVLKGYDHIIDIFIQRPFDPETMMQMIAKQLRYRKKPHSL